MIKNIDVLAKFVKGGAEVLQKAVKEDIDIELIEGSFVSNEELETLKTTVRDEGKKEGQTIGYDFAMKDVKKDFGIELEGKDRKAILDAAKAKIIADAKIDPDKKVKELSESLEKLQKTYQTDLETKTKEIETYQNQVKSFKLDGDLTAHIPQGLTGIKPAHFLMIAKTELTFDYDNGVPVAKKGDQILKDKMEKPIPVADVLTDFAKAQGWLSTGGRGGSEPGGGTSEFKTINDVYAHMEKNKIDPMSGEGQKLIAEFKDSQKQ